MQQDTLTAEVVSIGDEMTSGARLDTNAQWLSRRLGELGIEVTFHSTVGDTLQHNIDVFRTAALRADVVVCTGGLGPTRDDLTRQALADVVDQPLELRQSALDHIHHLFARRNREMPERNEVQAMFPVGSLEIFNPQGTAPGVDVTFDRPDGSGSRLFALPGVPAEMKRMFDETVAPRILESGGARRHIEHHVMKFFGVGESDMEQRLGEMIARDHVPRVGITVSSATISLRISAIGPSAQDCHRQIESTRAEIMQRVGELHFGDGEEFEQYHAVERMLTERGESLVSVELGRSAVLANWFASLGESSTYRGGFCFAKLGELATVLDCDAAAALETLRRRCGAQWLVAVDEYPSLESSDDQPLPAADVTLIVIDPTGAVLSTNSRLGGHPSIIYERIGKAALAWLRHVLTEPRAERSDNPTAAR
ncbi:Putative competence-damage inducible protein [Stieleria neptunia]|uniref:Competence-damage inducible protein n=1 Tax=Stieleria neptunia TaxID=2527979 RepID=A0A518HL16_9BACT|nr:molybdopterin-binding protein [Stieleria neptunia]QDV41537.1 Putative competence-damage inducible protein [Stieleria neptunia]